MLDNPGQGDNHNAPVFLRCYGRAADLVAGLAARRLQPRLMLDHSGNLLWGLAQMGQTDVSAALSRTVEPALAPSIEWLGTMWWTCPFTPMPASPMCARCASWRGHSSLLTRSKDRLRSTSSRVPVGRRMKGARCPG
jgi:hypothetical protein